jgi:RTX calcium-binding nonapeptide repeat (4 copies)
MGGLALIATGSAQARARPSCFGQRATKVGTGRDDSITGTKHRDVIVGLGGDDTIDGRGGNDLICGDTGEQDPNGGNDRLLGGAGDDQLDGEGGFDTLKGEGGADHLFAGLDAPGVADQADAQDFNKLFGGDGKDHVIGDRSNDVLFGDAGPDVIQGDKAGDRIDGGSGPDTIQGDLASGSAGGSDFIDSGSGRDTVEAGPGNDVILGGDEKGPGDKRLDGGTGDDQIRGDKGDDNLFGGPGGDDLDGGPGTDNCDTGDEPNDLQPKNCENGPPDACTDAKRRYTVTLDSPAPDFVPVASPGTVEVCKNETVKYVNVSQQPMNITQVSGPSNFQFPFGIAGEECGPDTDPGCNEVEVVFGDKGVVSYQGSRGDGTTGPVAAVAVRTR